ncbi:efflux RND transporter periplasmic adaptor subunit [Phytopseudomonas dryadis]|uniref:Efflux RND transporter periplasmic adaptor subunit n=1 Tax=Phytopseudomonas dryadis TaxID=2487520 RepID=A0ABY1Z4A8_9GAMM|nr:MULTISPECIES: efflux RND transporter periplasmic adaptor subunit [Pseudomonas]TBV00604.1 efflux RND transporter periplasmic adaptor subunit [Pseudomonas dryadis]TBV14484.1 efflux RND transporter periplasmic adaptor subunit [Pseudomonas sp. FRB 230]
MSLSRTSLLIVPIVLLGALAYWWLRAAEPVTDSVSSAVPVVLHEVARGDVAVLLRTLGRVRAQRSIEIRAQVDGTLVELPVAEGQRVRKGQLLARIDDRSLRASLNQAIAERGVTRAELDIARLDLERYQNLVRERAAPAQTLDQQKALVARLQATLATREAAVAAAQVQLSYTTIHSPIDGRLGIRNVDAGSLVRAGDATSLLSVVQLDPIDIEATLPQRRLGELQRMLAAPEQALVRAFREDGGEAIADGRLALIDNRVALDTGTIRVKALFDNADERLWPDQSVVVTLQADVLRDVLSVPLEAIRQRADGTFVWRVEDGKAAPVAVKVLHETDALAVVEGLEAGDQVVIDGQSRLREGVEVRAADAAPALAGGAG